MAQINAILNAFFAGTENCSEMYNIWLDRFRRDLSNGILYCSVSLLVSEMRLQKHQATQMLEA